MVVGVSRASALLLAPRHDAWSACLVTRASSADGILPLSTSGLHVIVVSLMSGGRLMRLVTGKVISGASLRLTSAWSFFFLTLFLRARPEAE